MCILGSERCEKLPSSSFKGTTFLQKFVLSKLFCAKIIFLRTENKKQVNFKHKWISFKVAVKIKHEQTCHGCSIHIWILRESSEFWVKSRLCHALQFLFSFSCYLTTLFSVCSSTKLLLLRVVALIWLHAEDCGALRPFVLFEVTGWPNYPLTSYTEAQLSTSSFSSSITSAQSGLKLQQGYLESLHSLKQFILFYFTPSYLPSKCFYIFMSFLPSFCPSFMVSFPLSFWCLSSLSSLLCLSFSSFLLSLLSSSLFHVFPSLIFFLISFLSGSVLYLFFLSSLISPWLPFLLLLSIITAYLRIWWIELFFCPTKNKMYRQSIEYLQNEYDFLTLSLL